MISRNYFFSGKVTRDGDYAGEYLTVYYHVTRREWLGDSAGVLRACIEQARRDGADSGYHGTLIIRAFNRV